MAWLCRHNLCPLCWLAVWLWHRRIRRLAATLTLEELQRTSVPVVNLQDAVD